METVWILGDQINRHISSLTDCKPGECRVLIVRSNAKVISKRWHKQRLHLVLSAMAHFAQELRDEGFEVDERRAATLADGVREHIAEFFPDRVVAMEPMSWDGRDLMASLGVETTPNNQFLCHYDEFADWAQGRKSFKMEDFYRWQRTRLDIFMDASGSKPQPVGGKWNFDHDNREPPPKDGRSWPQITRFELDDLDQAIIAEFGANTWGADPDGTWPVTRTQALTGNLHTQCLRRP